MEPASTWKSQQTSRENKQKATRGVGFGPDIYNKRSPLTRSQNRLQNPGFCCRSGVPGWLVPAGESQLAENGGSKNPVGEGDFTSIGKSPSRTRIGCNLHFPSTEHSSGRPSTFNYLSTGCCLVVGVVVTMCECLHCQHPCRHVKREFFNLFSNIFHECVA